MKQATLPTYKKLQQALNKTSLKLHPSQVHGLVCGILCGNSTSSEEVWEGLIAGDKSEEESPATHQLLADLYEFSKKQLEDFLFELQLVLPSDDDSLPERAEALTVWCQGFLTGLKMAQVQLIGREPGETTEAINDIIEIAKMNYEEVVSSEEDEVAFVELVEYVRMAVILIYQDLHESNETRQIINSSGHLH